MTNRFVVFHAGVDSLVKYYPLMEVSRKALHITNPGAEYIVLTDEKTAPHLRDFHTEVLAPEGPLMLSYLIAQLEYCKKTKDGMSVLAATDCVANRNLDKALQHPVAITYRHRGVSLINNIAYVHDHGRMAWFLNRALGYLPHDQQDWLGDQAAWEKALGPSEDWETVKGEIKVARPDGVEIHLYPCETHNYFNKLTGTTRRHTMPSEPYLMHFKGKRKAVMVEMVDWCILHGKDRDHIRLARKPRKKDLYDEVRNALHVGHSKGGTDSEHSMFKAFRANIRKRLGKIKVPRPYRHRVTVTEDVRSTETLVALTESKVPPEGAARLVIRLTGRNAVDQPIIIAVCGDTECLIDGYRRVWYRHAVGHDTTKAYIVKYNDWGKYSKESLPGESSQ